jgi:hypothetical protein
MLLRTFRKAAPWLYLALSIPTSAVAQSGYAHQGAEHAATGTLPGDQVLPKISIKSSGGFMVWQDNVTDGDGAGISAVRLDSSLSAVLSPFRVNQNGTNDQEMPQVAMLNNNGAVFVWQGGRPSYQHIYARFMTPTYTWLTGDIQVNTATNKYQVEPVVATLANSNIVVVWSSFNQASSNSMQDVYAQLFTPAGVKVGGEFLVNQFTTYNQRSAAVAALKGGGFVISWISEMQTRGFSGLASSTPYSGTNQASVDVYARVFANNGSPQGNEFVVNTALDPCASPSIAAGSDGSFMITWAQRNLSVRQNSWDIFARPFSSTGVGGASRVVNTTLYGDQYSPQISSIGTDYMVVWTSLGQDGSREGVYGQFLQHDGSANGGEFRVNTTTISQQMHPAVASDGSSRFMAVWTSFVGGAGSFDLFAQRYAVAGQALSAPAAPFVTVLGSDSLGVSWPAVAGMSVANYEVFADGSPTASSSTTNNWCDFTGLPAGSTHWFQMDYVLSDGRHSPLSAAATNSTYSSLSWGGIPYDWMTRYFGSDVSKWPSPTADSDGDGVSNLNEFLAGTDPTSAASVLKVSLQKTSQGMFLDWNTQPGLIYQVQSSSDLKNWSSVGLPRFAAGSTDSIYVGGAAAANYRVLRLR